MKKKPPPTSWGKVSSQYHATVEQADSYQQSVIVPNLLRLLGDVTKKSIIDIGCGEGVFCRALATAGALTTGVDIAPEMIEIAQTTSPKSIQFKVAAADNLSFAKDASYDTAIMIHAIQNIEKIRETFQESARILKTNGILVVVINHPAFRIPKRSSWLWDSKTAAQVRRVDAYMSESREAIDMDPGKTAAKRFTYSFHRPLQSYFKTLTKCGFVIDGLEEWISHKISQKGPRAQAEDTARKEFPMFMMIRAKKIK